MAVKMADLIGRLGLQTDKCGLHTYGDFYDKEFAKWRDKPISLLEIGVAAGWSMRLWWSYFPQAARIVGIDRDLGQVLEPTLLRLNGVKLVEGDAYTPGMTESLGLFDVIIEDGAHTLHSQLLTLALYLPHLEDGGVLVIEDVQSLEWLPDLGAFVPPGFQDETVDMRHMTKRCTDNMLFVVRRNP